MKKLNIANIKEWAQKLFSRKEVKKEHSADGVWAVLFSVSMILVVATSIGHLYLFIQVENDRIFQVVEEEENKQIEINIEALEEVINQFEQKEARFDNFMNDKPDIIDPSL